LILQQLGQNSSRYSSNLLPREVVSISPQHNLHSSLISQVLQSLSLHALLDLLSLGKSVEVLLEWLVH
jgi:hypothetical protein